jgi:hypothetical protein
MPDPALCSTRYSLARDISAGVEYLVYDPAYCSFTVNLLAMADSRMLSIGWFNPATGAAIHQDPIAAGSPFYQFTTPFSRDAVLYLVDILSHT